MRGGCAVRLLVLHLDVVFQDVEHLPQVLVGVGEDVVVVGDIGQIDRLAAGRAGHGQPVGEDGGGLGGGRAGRVAVGDGLQHPAQLDRLLLAARARLSAVFVLPAWLQPSLSR